MTKTRNLFALLILSLSLGAAAQAQQSRTYVETVGSDFNPCTLGKPCRTLNAAISKTNAGGEVVIADSGEYLPATVTKALTILAAPRAEPVIRAGAGQSAVNINAPGLARVVLRRLTLAGPGKAAAGSYGVNYADGNSVHIEHCVISDFDRGINFELPGGHRFHVSETTVRGNGHGIYVAVPGGTEGGASVSRSRMEHNTVGLTSVGSPSHVTVSDSVASGNGYGFKTADGGLMVITDCVATNNTEDGVYVEGGEIHLASSTVAGNRGGLNATGGKIYSLGNNLVGGNYHYDFNTSGNVVTVAGK